MFEKQWVVYATNPETGFIDFVSSHRTEWGAIRACEKMQERSLNDFAHLGKGLVQYAYEPCREWADREIEDVMHPRNPNRYHHD